MTVENENLEIIFASTDDDMVRITFIESEGVGDDQKELSRHSVEFTLTKCQQFISELKKTMKHTVERI